MRDVNWTCAPKRGWAVPGAGAVRINDDSGLVLFKSTAELTVRTVKVSKLPFFKITTFVIVLLWPIVAKARF